MFDTHCHLNFSRFKKNYDEVIKKAQSLGVVNITIPGTDFPTSQKAVAIASEYENIFAAVGIHPHHVYEIKEETYNVKKYLDEIEQLILHTKVVAVGEIGMDRHVYEDTKYEKYNVDEKFIDTQRLLFREQVLLAIKYKKSIIVHNREAKQDLLPVLREIWSSHLEGHAVFHCCEPDEELLNFAKEHKMFIGVDGDITYREDKQAFVKKIPLEMLVLETDSPFLLPEPLRSQKLFPNKPENIPLIAEFIANVRGENVEKLQKATLQNGKHLFQID